MDGDRGSGGSCFVFSQIELWYPRKPYGEADILDAESIKFLTAQHATFDPESQPVS